MVLILQRYLLRDLVRAFLLSLVAVTAVMVVLMMGQLLSRGVVSGGYALRAVPLFLPLVLAYTIPATLLFATTLVYGRFAQDNEYDAVRMSGIHPVVVLTPAVALAVILCCAVLYLAGEEIPRAYYRVRNLAKNVAVAKEAFFRALAQTGTWGDSIFTIWTDSVEGDTAYGVRIEKRDPRTRRPELIVEAESATFHFDEGRAVVEVRARGARVETFGPTGATQARFEDTHLQRFPLVPPPRPRPRDLPLSVLLRRLGGGEWGGTTTAPAASSAPFDERELLRRQRERRRMWTEVHLRLNLALSPLSFVLVGMPLAIRFRRGHILAAFLVALGPMLLFHLTTLTAKNLCTSGAWPVTTPWLASLLLWVLAAVLNQRLLRH